VESSSAPDYCAVGSSIKNLKKNAPLKMSKRRKCESIGYVDLPTDVICLISSNVVC